MGNTVPPRMCRKEAGTAAAGTATVARRRPKNVAAVAAAPDAVTPCKQRDDDAEQEDGTTRRRRRAGPASWADDDAGKASAAATVATVKIVLKRKDAEALLARLNAQSARERKARMAELKGELRAVDCGGASPASCRDAWRPQLAPIKEN